MNLADSQLGLAKARERRRYPRVKVNKLAYLTIEPNNGGILLDLSESGMCISVANPLGKVATVCFSVAAEAQKAVEGTGRISWLSESGRSAGVEFLDFPDEARGRLMGLLTGGNPPAKASKPQPAAARRDETAARAEASGLGWRAPAGASEGPPAARSTGGTGEGAPSGASEIPESRVQDPPPSYSMLFAPTSPRPEAVPSEESSADDEGEAHQSKLETPLFFLPQKRESESGSPWASSEGAESYPGAGEKYRQDGDDESVAAFRSAVVTESDSTKREGRGNRLFAKILLGVTICAALLAGGVGVLLYYHNALPSLPSFHWTESSPPAQQPPKAMIARRPVRRGARRRTPVRNERGSRPVGDVSTFYATRPAQTRFPVEMTDPSHRRWLATVTSQTMAPSETSRATGSSGPIPTPSVGQMGALRIDGALVEEGAAPSPERVDAQTAVPAPIVVEATIAKSGGVTGVRLISSPTSQMAQAVIEAVKSWHYRPLYLDGRPIEYTTRITFDFSGSGKER